MKETADALSAAHALSVIHRDIKPDNILLEGTRGRVMVTDFGIAKALSASSGATLTGAGVAIGTPAFMSPEQAAGEREIDGRSDLYSLGIVAYQMLTGELPFNAPTVAGILMKQITEPAPDRPRQAARRAGGPRARRGRCLEKDPENRWPTADALRRALESRTVAGYRPTGLGWRTGSGIRRGPRGAPADPPAEPPAGPARRRRPAGVLDRAQRPGGRLTAATRSPRRARGRQGRRERRARPLSRTPASRRSCRRCAGQFASWAAVSLGLLRHQRRHRARHAVVPLPDCSAWASG